jgi:hypothetical protein
LLNVKLVGASRNQKVNGGVKRFISYQIHIKTIRNLCQYSTITVMHFLFNLLIIKGLYMFRAAN